MIRPIAIGLSPNTEGEDISLAASQIISPWKYKRGQAIAELENWFVTFFKVPYAVSFSSGRGALYAILAALNIKRGDEVIMQGFTCVVVANSIIATGAKPVYADVSRSLTLDPVSVEKKITKKTKVILVQHTFGIPTDMDAILKIAKKYNLFVVEDVAHTIGGEYKKHKLGTLADAAFFSFGRDKAFSGVFGGMAITNRKIIGEKIRLYQKQKQYPRTVWIFQQLFHPLAFSIILPLYDFFGLGKLILVTLQKLHLLSKPVSSLEKRGIFHATTIRRMPNALAALALLQVKKITLYNQRRRAIAARYRKLADELKLEMPVKRDHIPFLRFPLLFNQPATIRKFFRDNGHVYVGDWYANVIDPRQSNFSAVYYKRGMCPHAEQLSRRVINLPTYPTMSDEDVNRVLELVKTYVTG